MRALTNKINRDIKKVNFRAIEIESINCEKEAVDLSKIIGNILNSQYKILEVVELKDEDMKILEEQIPQLFLTYIVKIAILNAIK